MSRVLYVTVGPPLAGQLAHQDRQPHREQLGVRRILGLGTHWGAACLLCLSFVLSDSVLLPILSPVAQAQLPRACLYGQARQPHHGDDGGHHVTPHLWLGLWEWSPARLGCQGMVW